MAAGLGFKTFTTGEVLTAADVNGYLMQGVLVFASEAARDAAITSPQEGQFAFTKDNNSLWYYDSAAWVASGATGDIEGVTAGTGISGGGTSGTVTITNSMATAIDAKADLVVGTGADTFSVLAVGANGTVLTAASGEATGLQWAAPAGASFSGVSVYNSATQVIADSTFTVLTFDSEEFDTDSYHSTITNTGRITCTSEGKYLFNAQATFPIGTTGRLLMRFRKNGVTTVETGTFDYAFGSSGDDSVSISKILDVEENDYFEFLVYQTTGGDLDCFSGLATTWFQAAYLGA